MSLSDLPDDILGLISNRLNGFDNCSLWMASDSKLKQRLVNYVITEFDVVYSTAGRYLWPGNFLKKLQKLFRLSLVVEQQVYHLPIENVEVIPIETLKYLKLDFNNCDDFVARKQFVASADSTGPTTSSGQYINMNDLYPNLEHFELRHIGSYRRVNFTIDLLSCLPRNLKTFSMPHNPLAVVEKSAAEDLNRQIGLLPRTLISLNLSVSGVRRKPCLDFSKLPPNLTSLTTNTVIERESYHLIPETITALDLRGTDYNIKSLAPFLPAGLRSLSTSSSSMPGDSLAHLQNLEHFELYCTSSEPIFITKYPPNLKKCYGYFDSDQSFKILPFLHGITTISLNLETGLDRQFFITLPKTVTKLTLNPRDAPDSFEFFGLLPRNLKTLETNLPIIEKLSLLPESLTDLQLIPFDPTDIAEDDRLPSKLQILSLNGIDVPKSILVSLPEHLERLELESESMIIDDEIIESLPKGLKSLNLFTKLNITDASASKYPPNLEYLYFDGKDEMTDNAIQQLPRSLTSLFLLKNANLTDECIKYLPRKLLELNLQSCEGISSKSCKDLPQYLCNLRLSNCKDWSIESLEELPRYLKLFQVEPSEVNSAFLCIMEEQRGSWKWC